MKTRRLLRGFVAALALAWTVFWFSWAATILLPVPHITFWLSAVFVSEFSLLVALFALVGLALAAIVRRMGFRRTSVAAIALGVATVVLSLVPVGWAWQTARTEGVSLSFPEYFAGISAIPEHPPTETVEYARPDGDELTLDVWEPPGSSGGERPAIVMVHGGSWENGERSFARRASWFADKGYVVFDIGYRLAPPPRWQDATGDVKCAVGWVRENAGEYGVNPDRVALEGDSAGGHLALLAAYSEGNSDLPPSCDVPDTGAEAVIAFYPPTEMTRFCGEGLPDWYPELDCRGTLERFIGGTPEEMPERYRLVSPATHVDSESPPTFMVQGGRDQLVAPEQSPILARELEREGVPYRLLEIPYARHSFDLSWGGWGNQITTPKVEEFLDRRLPLGEEGS